MPGTIVPLPVMLEEEDQKIYDRLEPPKTVVVRYGYMRQIAELSYDGKAKPGCGSKMVIRTKRGIEMAEMLTTTCPNSGCGKSVSRKEMLQYVENSGGKNYPFTTHGKVLRVATIDDMRDQEHFDSRKPDIIKLTKSLIREYDLPMQLVEVELLLGGERIIFHYTSEQWVDFRDLVKRLAQEYQTRIEMHQVNARDEARLVADYEKCGQHCCCKQFLKVLKPVSMRSAKVQKATLDPTKISGRCGRLMCCLRYEDQTYNELRKRLPRKQTRVKTEDGPGTVIDTQILTQLLLVRLDDQPGLQAYPLENVEKLSKEEDAQLRAEAEQREKEREERMRHRGKRGPRKESRGKDDRPPRGEQRDKGEPRRPKPGQPLKQSEIESAEGDRPINVDEAQAASNDATQPQAGRPTQGAGPPAVGGGKKKRKRRRKRKRRGGGGDGQASGGGAQGGDNQQGGGGDGGGGKSQGGGNREDRPKNQGNKGGGGGGDGPSVYDPDRRGGD